MGEQFSLSFFPDQRRGEALALFHFMSNLGDSSMFTIIIRHAGRDTTATANTQIEAQTLFDALTKTFLVVEMWRGAELVRSYNNQ